jgi:transposase
LDGLQANVKEQERLQLSVAEARVDTTTCEVMFSDNVVALLVVMHIYFILIHKIESSVY